jgi:hypothetical protein
MQIAKPTNLQTNPSQTFGRVPLNVRTTCPGLPWGVHGPKTMGDPDFLPRGATNVRVCGFH